MKTSLPLKKAARWHSTFGCPSPTPLGWGWTLPHCIGATPPVLATSSPCLRRRAVTWITIGVFFHGGACFGVKCLIGFSWSADDALPLKCTAWRWGSFLCMFEGDYIYPPFAKDCSLDWSTFGPISVTFSLWTLYQQQDNWFWINKPCWFVTSPLIIIFHIFYLLIPVIYPYMGSVTDFHTGNSCQVVGFVFSLFLDWVWRGWICLLFIFSFQKFLVIIMGMLW